MFNILCELHFLNQNDAILVDSSDFGAFVYQDRKSVSGSSIYEGKAFYCKGRGVSVSLSNKRPKKLKDCLTELEQLLAEQRVVRVEWQCPTTVCLTFNNGAHSYVKLNAWSCDPEELTFDRFMVGKLTSCVSDVAIHLHHALFAYTDNQVLLAHLSKPHLKWSTTKKWNALDVKLHEVKLAGPSGRRLDKSVSFNSSGDMLLMWWKCGKDEVYPWSPRVKAEDRANVHIYSLNGMKFDLVCYYRTAFDPISITFSYTNYSTIYTIQQRVSDEGAVTLEWENARLDNRHLINEYSLSLPLPTHVSALALSPKEDKLLAACIDGSLLVADSYGNVTNRIRSNLIASLVSWHPDGGIVLIGNNRGQLQWYDCALASITCQITTHDMKSSALDVGSYFKYQPNLLSVHWNRHSNTPTSIDDYLDTLLLCFEKGPLVLLKLICTHERRFTTDAIIHKYLSLGSYGNALNLLHAIDWGVDPELAMASLQSIISFCLRQPLSPATESAIEKGLGCFLNPIRPIPDSVTSEFADGVMDLARKFFHQLLRYQCFDKAFRLAIDLGKKDLFMDLHSFYGEIGHYTMSAAAWERAEQLSSSGCQDSESSCDYSESCSSSEHSETSPSSSDVDSETTQELREKILPPLVVTSPLESAQNKVGYSSILHQYNYRRNPPLKTALPPTSSNSFHALPAHSAQNTYLTSTSYDFADYFTADLSTSQCGKTDTDISDEIDCDSMLLRENCIVHHPNTPASRAPLQYNSQSSFLGEHFSDSGSLNQVICTKPVTQVNDYQLGKSHSLKVANARKVNNGAFSQAQSNIHQSTTCLISGLSQPPLFNSIGNVPDLHRDYEIGCDIHDSINPPKIDQPLNGLNQRLLQGINLSEPTSSFDVSHEPSTGRAADVPPYRRPSSTLTRQSNPRYMPSFVSDSDRTTKAPIIASAETEDGKIKVVHFGLV